MSVLFSPFPKLILTHANSHFLNLFNFSFVLSSRLYCSPLLPPLSPPPSLSSPSLSGSPLTEEAEGGSEQRNIQTLGLVGQLSGDLSPLEPPSPLFPDSPGGGSLTSEVFFNVMRLNSRKREFHLTKQHNNIP